MIKMSFDDWLANGHLKRHVSSRDELEKLYRVIRRDIKAAGNRKMDDDWRFVAAYNAALQSAGAALKAAGYEVPKAGGAHFQTIESLKLTIRDDGTIVDPLQKFRAKRGGGISKKLRLPAIRRLRSCESSRQNYSIRSERISAPTTRRLLQRSRRNVTVRVTISVPSMAAASALHVSSFRAGPPSHTHISGNQYWQYS